MKDVLAAALFFTTLLIVIFQSTSNPKPEDKQEVSPVVPVEPVMTAIIEMQLADWCGPCRRFKASGAIKELERKGWEIRYTDGIAKTYPSFRVWVDGKSSTFSGYSSKDGFFRKLKSVIKKLEEST